MFSYFFYKVIFMLLLMDLIEAKILLSDLLTNENELVILEASSLSSSIKGSNATKLSQIKLLDDKYVKSKIVVNILSKNKTHDENAVSQKNTVISFSSKKLTPCDQNACKSNEICVYKKATAKDRKEYKCILKMNKTNKTRTLVKRNLVDLKSIQSTTLKPPTSSQLKSNLLKSNCKSSQEVTSVRLKLFERFQNKSNEFNFNKEFIQSSQSICLKAILVGFRKLDRDEDGQIDYPEWSQLKYDGECDKSVFKTCDLNNDSNLSMEELCGCFDDSQNKCFFIRNEKNTNELKFYIQNLGDYFELKIENYLPICDETGLFMPLQCDGLVNCWCVDKDGIPQSDSFRRIDQDHNDCLYNNNYYNVE